MVNFTSISQDNFARTGILNIPVNGKSFRLETPFLFPVVSLITGSTSRGGGFWKYVLQADSENGLLRRNIPVMSQVLHFLDFQSTTPTAVIDWRRESIRGKYNNQLEGLDYSAPIFLDSGGFKLMWGQSVDLSNYGLTIENGSGPKTIFDLQQDFGGNIIASLDYPIPPGLSHAEARERMNKSQKNAISAAQLIRDSDYDPFLFVAVHGQTKEAIRDYVKCVFYEFAELDLCKIPFGLAIGSLVPLRGSRKHSEIVSLVQGVIEGIPPDFRSNVPIHVFGITGNLIPILAYLGVDSFDSSTYAQQARNLHYLEPNSKKLKSVLELDEWFCKCKICEKVSLKEIQDGLVTSIKYKPLKNGVYKSKYYSDIALHNLEMDFEILSNTREAIKNELLQEYLVEYTHKNPQLLSLVELLSKSDQKLSKLMSRTHKIVGKPKNSDDTPRISKVSLRYSSLDFNILETDFKGPKKAKSILLLIPCSQGKPYSTSRTHRFITKVLLENLEKKSSIIHKVTLSGLYGPVPEEYEKLQQVMEYDFQLQSYDYKQIEMVTERVDQYITKYSNHYSLLLGYATSKAYRTVLENVAKKNKDFRLFPRSLHNRRLTEFFRTRNIEELIKFIQSHDSLKFNTGET
jgi:7-cyano-7-deazaguanine tRNA-ribosyltransferase